jgi:hypothetical protein
MGLGRSRAGDSDLGLSLAMTGGANNSRLVSKIYPDGRQPNYNYCSGVNDAA